MYEYFERLLDEYNVTAADVCRATGIPSNTISTWKKRNSNLNYKQLQQIADYFNVDVAYFFDGKRIHKDFITGEMVRDDLIDYETQVLVKNRLLKKMLIAGGKIVDENPELIEAVTYTLEKMGEKK